jgi:hypothetical protein
LFQDSSWALLRGSTILTNMAVVNIPDYVLTQSKPNKVSSNDFKCLCLTTMARFLIFYGVVVKCGGKVVGTQEDIIFYSSKVNHLVVCIPLK